MDSHIKKLNRDMVIGWLVIVCVLLFAYTMEVVKGERSLPYLIVFLVLTVAPAIGGLFQYRKNPTWNRLSYFIAGGYLIMYVFVMVTSKSAMVSTYIYPMLSLMVLYHNPNLILVTGVASMAVNVVSVVYRFMTGFFTVETSNQAEIQIAAITLCFSFSYVAAKLYEDITKQNEDYVHMLNEKNEQIQNMTVQTITAIAKALDAKDSYSEGHSRRVAVYSAQIAEKLGMSEEDVQNLRTVALLHDIGKIGVPDSVLNKPARLTEEEFQMMKQHSVVGSEILKDITMIPGVDIGTKYHHERYDGRGYPEGLKGEDIPYIARIIAVADAYDAMTSNRVYRKHLTYEQVIAEFEKGGGTQFDPEIARIMRALIESGEMKNLSPDDPVREPA